MTFERLILPHWEGGGMMYRTAIAPLVGIIFLAIKGLFGVEVGQELQDQVVEVLAVGFSVGFAIYGVFKNHKKKEDK